MAIVKCGKGHFYDDSKYNECPTCAKKGSDSGNDDIKTMALFGKKSSDDEKTIGIGFKNNKCDPVTGWLVCIDGPMKGKDFRIHSGRNFIGRDYSNDISLSYDTTVSRTGMGSIIYEPHKNIFLAANGEGSGIYINGNPINAPKVITEDDIIGIGQYSYALVAYCKGDKKW